MSPQTIRSNSQSARLLASLADFEQVIIVMHDNPDPDAIATGWALACLVEERLCKPVRVVGGGAIERAENKHMVDLLRPPIELASRLQADEQTAIVLVDCGVGATNHIATQSKIRPDAVIDHHLHDDDAADASFVDIRPDAAASASIAASYLREQKIDPGVRLATAILYAIRTETCGGETQYSALDRSVVKWLTDLADMGMLAEIENAPLDRDYFRDLMLAMQQTFLYGDAALCFLPRASGAEIVGEVADLLIRCRGLRRVLCAAVIGGDLVLSARTERGCGNATKLLLATLDGVGGCGGHAHRAGGKIHLGRNGGRADDDLYDKLRSRWLGACGAPQKPGVPLVDRREIAEHL